MRSRAFRPLGLPIHVARVPTAPFARSYPRHFTFYVADPISSIASRPHCKHLPGMIPGFGAGLVIPDLWQQEAVRALQQGKDVVVQAPTGSGKTYIFELLYPNLKTQAVFTVPTRALAPTLVALPSTSLVPSAPFAHAVFSSPYRLQAIAGAAPALQFERFNHAS
jgi:hypothetical protein